MDESYYKIISSIQDSDDILLYHEGKYVYFLSKSLKNGTLLVEECSDKLIIWSNELTCVSYKTLYRQFIKYIKLPLYIVYIESQEECEEIIELGGKKIEFQSDEESASCNNYGSYCLAE